MVKFVCSQRLCVSIICGNVIYLFRVGHPLQWNESESFRYSRSTTNRTPLDSCLVLDMSAVSSDNPFDSFSALLLLRRRNYQVVLYTN